jgi:hypothetical protein
MAHEEEEEDSGFALHDLADLEYNPDPAFLTTYLDEVLTDAYANIQLNRNPPAKKAFALLQKHRDVIRHLLSQIFWLAHLKMHRPSDLEIIDEIETSTGKFWGNFLFPLETDMSLDGRVRDIFVECIPYLMTQC